MAGAKTAHPRPLPEGGEKEFKRFFATSVAKKPLKKVPPSSQNREEGVGGWRGFARIATWVNY
jgi:hypothetical protein